MAKYLNLTGLQTLWTKIKAVFALKENGVYYVPGTSGYANWAANTAYAVGANVVNPSGECWTCKTAHTSGSSWSSTNWYRISAVALTGTIDGVTALYAGLKIAYRFQVLGGEGSTTLNVNNLGAKTITRGTGAFYRWTIGRNGVAILVYDGSTWRFGDYDSNDQYVLPDACCSTAAGTQAKAATSIGFSYSRHNDIPFRIYFTNANTYNGNLTLNVNGQGAKPLWINGSASSSSNKTIAVGVYWCYYDGTQFQLWTDKSIWGLKVRGDGSNLTEAFTPASSRANIASGESNATIFGKIAKWLSDLKSLAFKDAVSDSDISGTISNNHIASASTWNGKYTKPSDGIPKGDLASAVQTSLGKADSALQSESDPVFSASPAAGITSDNITGWNGKADGIHFHSEVLNVTDSITRFLKMSFSGRVGRCSALVAIGANNGNSAMYSCVFRLSFFYSGSGNIGYFGIDLLSTDDLSKKPLVYYDSNSIYIGIADALNMGVTVSVMLSCENTSYVTYSTVTRAVATGSDKTNLPLNKVAVFTEETDGRISYSMFNTETQRKIAYAVQGRVNGTSSPLIFDIADTVGTEEGVIYFT